MAFGASFIQEVEIGSNKNNMVSRDA
jgi:hypothetical protein